MIGQNPGRDDGHEDFPELDALLDETMRGILTKLEAAFDPRERLTRAAELSNHTDERAQAFAQMATGHVLLAISEEIAAVRAQLDQVSGIRREVAGLSQAVQELTAILAKAADPVAEAARALPDIANAISDVPDHGEVLDGIATAVESLVAAIDDRRSAQGGEVPA